MDTLTVNNPVASMNRMISYWSIKARFALIRILRIMRITLLGTAAGRFLLPVVAFAGDNVVNAKNATHHAFSIIMQAIQIIASVVGAIFILVGVVRFVSSHANEDGPGQQKAIMMLATGLGLIIIIPALKLLNVESLIVGINGTDGGTDSGGGDGDDGTLSFSE